ncbi:MAG: helix-turn-helix domain-containing transcriptional regulator [Alphaproteobacteria bacterium]
MTRKYQKFQDYLVGKLKNPEYAQEFLDVAIEDYEENGNTEEFMLSLRYLAEAKGGITRLSEVTKLNRQNLYKVLTGKTSPRLDTTFSIVKGLGYQLRSQPMDEQRV